jgi:tetratricopeptide (TPR) repeat protein
MMADGQHEEARECFQKSLDIFGEYFEGWDIAITLAYLADATLLSGDKSEAQKNYIEALHTANRIHSIPLTLMALAGLAQLESRSHPELAVDWLNLIIAHPAAMQETRDRACRILSKMKKSSGAGPVRGLRESLSDQSLEDLVGSILK